MTSLPPGFVLDEKKVNTATNTPAGFVVDASPPSYLERLHEDVLRRGSNVGDAIKGTNLNPLAGRNFQTPIETGLQVAGQGGGLLMDAMLTEPIKSAINYFAPESFKKDAADAAQDLAASKVGRVVGAIKNKYGEFAKENPVLNRNLAAGANLAAFTSPIGPVSVSDITGGAINATGKAVYQAPFSAAKTGYNVVNKATDVVAGGISNKLQRTGLAPEIAKNVNNAPRSNAEVLFLKTLEQEGVGINDALAALEESRKLGVTPSVAVTSNIPQMQRQGFLTSQASGGSKVAADALKDITSMQIPKLNESIIRQATGGDPLGAEQYGSIVAKQAKSMVDSKVATLKTRAAPYYERSVGLDKSIPIENPSMQKALSNPVVARSLEQWRTDPYTLSNVKNDLSNLGISAEELAALPYNSTISLHAARTHLRGLADTAFRNGDGNAQKAIKSALSEIDNTIESVYPDYKTARRIYSEDSGALKALKESPVGKMATFAEGDYSKIANDLMTKDPQYIRKFTAGTDQKMRDALAGSFLKRQLEESAKDGLRFSDKVFRSQGNSERLRALVGDDRFNQMNKIDSVIDELFATKQIAHGSMTAANQAIQDGVTFPLDKDGIFTMIRAKIAPSLFEMVRRDPAQAKRFNELLLTDEGRILLESISKGNRASGSDIEKIGNFLNKNATKLPQEVK